MSFRVMPLSRSHLPGATLSTNVKAAHKGYPFSNLVTNDPLQVGVGRGLWIVTAGVNDDIPFNEGGPELTATIAAGTYWGWPNYAVAVASAMNTAGSNWVAYQIQDGSSSDLYHWRLSRTSGTGALLCNSGTSTDTAWDDLGYSTEYDRSAAASHVGDFSAIHQADGEHVDYDLGSAKTADVAVIGNPQASAGFRPVVKMGSSSSVTDFSAAFDNFDDELMVQFFDSPQTYQYARFELRQPRRSDGNEVGAGLLWLGRYVELEHGWEWNTYARQGQLQLNSTQGLRGVPFLSELRAQERFRVDFQAGPGLSDEDAGIMVRLLRELGTSEYAIVSLDQTPARVNAETKLCKLTQAPSLPHRYVGNRRGRWSIPLEFEVLAVN